MLSRSKSFGRERRSMCRIAPAGLTAIFLTGCASSNPDAGRVVLPATPPTFGKPVKLPVAKVGKSLRTFGLESYAAALEANHRLLNDRAFWEGVRREYEKTR